MAATKLTDPLPHESPLDPSPESRLIVPASPGAQMVTLSAILLPFAGLVAAIFLLWGWGVTWTDLGLLIALYFLTVFGVTVGFHRLFTHAAFETSEWVKFVFAALGSLSIEGPVFQWVAMHRRHHQHSDKVHDPHSPHHHGKGFMGWLKGALHAHMGWFFEADLPGVDRYIPDLKKSRALRAANSLFPLWMVLSLALPALLGGLISGTWKGALTGLIWGGLVRIFIVHHVTWSVNSACHLWGRRPFASNDLSRNNLIFGFLALGEGWHNNHHAFPSSARHGLRWWQVDLSYSVIQMLKVVGLAWNVRLPALEAMTKASAAA